MNAMECARCIRDWVDNEKGNVANLEAEHPEWLAGLNIYNSWQRPRGGGPDRPESARLGVARV